MFVNMDIMNINNVSNSLSHFESTHSPDDDDVVTPSNATKGTKRSSKIDNQLMRSSIGRKRKTRRFKSRYKGKLSRKSHFDILKQMKRRVYPQSEAPYNTNQFLMAEHTIENLDDNLVFVKKGERHRDPSFTSVDSDEDQFYSSPEDEDEFLSKDFADTYQSVCAEKFGDLSKSQLTKIIFELETKVEELQKKCNTNSKMDEMSVMLKQMNGFENDTDSKTKIVDVISENELLRRENEALKKFIKDNAVTTSSSSSSSSDESGSSSSEHEMNVENPTERTC